MVQWFNFKTNWVKCRASEIMIQIAKFFRNNASNCKEEKTFRKTLNRVVDSQLEGSPKKYNGFDTNSKLGRRVENVGAFNELLFCSRRRNKTPNPEGFLGGGGEENQPTPAPPPPNTLKKHSEWF